MAQQTILDHISRGRTDRVIDLIRLPGWQECLHEGRIKALQWFVY